jgi:hypothetical protein
LYTYSLSERRGFTVIECVICFAVVPDPASGALISTAPAAGLVMERLTKEMVKAADGPVNLVEAMGFPVNFRKVLTRNVIKSFAKCH